MVNINPRKAGDSIYEQYTVVRTFQLASTVAAVKGNCYTVNAEGRLVALTAVAGLVDVSKGLFQAAADRAAATYTEGNGPTVQCFVTPAWILLKGAADLVEGTRVAISAALAVVTPDTVMALPSTGTINNLVGKLHQILTLDDTENPKSKTAAGDLVVVQLGVF